MFHRAARSAHISHTSPAVGAETTLVHRHHGVEDGKGVGDVVAVAGEETHLERVSPVTAVYIFAMQTEIADGYRREVSGDGVRHTVVEGAAAVGGVGAHRIAEAAAGGLPAAWHRYGVLVGGFVCKHVATWEPRSAEGVRRLLEHRPEVVDDVSRKMETAHAVVLHIASAVVENPHQKGVANVCPVRHAYGEVTVVVIHRTAGVVHKNGVHRG